MTFPALFGIMNDVEWLGVKPTSFHSLHNTTTIPHNIAHTDMNTAQL